MPKTSVQGAVTNFSDRLSFNFNALASEAQDGDAAGHVATTNTAHEVHAHNRGKCSGAVPDTPSHVAYDS